jgi:DNA-binding LacI/PurR family transcriptional regulator
MVLNPLLLESSVFPRGGSLAPVVLLGEVADSPVDHVRMDDRAACREMTSLLIHEGHRRIAVVGKMDTPTATLRLAGYLAALRDAGLERREALEIDTTAWTPASGAAATRRYLAQHELPDAMFCFTDALALGVLSVLWSQGARVPDDVSVAGYDDVAMSEFAVPPLTTVRFDRQLIAEAALTLLSQRIADHDRPITSITVPHRIVRRASTRSRRT